MKKNFLFSIIVLLCTMMNVSKAWADDWSDYLTASNGFTEVTTVNDLQSGSNYYYVFQSAENPALVLATGKYAAKPGWASDGSWSMHYANAASSPATDLRSYYILDYNATYGIGVHSALNPGNCFQTHSGASYMWVNTYNETASSEWSGLLPTYVNGYWIFQEYQFRANNDSYLGPWDPAIGATDGMNIAGNRTNTSGDEAGHFKVYRIAKTDYESLKTRLFDEALYAATTSNPVNATYRLTNPSFETGDLTGWTTNGAEDNGEIKTVGVTSNGDGQYALNMFQWWSGMNASQTVSLPAGLYDVSAVVACWEIDDVTFTAGGQSVTNTGQGEATGIPVTISNVSVGSTNSLTISANSNADWWSDGRSTETDWRYACGFFKLDNVQLTCKGVYLSGFATALPNDNTTVLTPGQWYYYDTTSLGNYSLNGDLTDMVYTQNGNQIMADLQTKQPHSTLTLNAGRVYFMTTGSGVTLEISNQTEEGSSTTFTVCALNVDGLPQTVAGISLNADGPGSEGTKLISQYLASKGYSFIGVSEDFNYHGSLMSALTGYNCGTVRDALNLSHLLDLLGDGIDNDGLNLIWNTTDGYAASNESWTQWTSRASTAGNQYIRKGYRYYTMQLEEGVLIDVYVLHMDANDGGDEELGINSRNAQWTQLAAEIMSNSYTDRPKLIIGDTNSRFTREAICRNFIEAVATKYTAKDAWVEWALGGDYIKAQQDPSGYGWGYVDASNPLDYSKYEVVDKVIFLNPVGSNTPQLSLVNFQINQDYTYGTVNGTDDATALGDHKPLVVTLKYTAPAYEFDEEYTRWTWLGEAPVAGATDQYIRNVYWGSPANWSGEAKQPRGFLSHTGELTYEPTNDNLWNLWGDLSSTSANTSISYTGNYHLYMKYAATSDATGVEQASSGASTFKIVPCVIEGVTGAYHFQRDLSSARPDRLFNAENANGGYSAAKNTSPMNAWLFISLAQKAMYDRYKAAWSKGSKYLSMLPLPADTKDELATLLENNTNWQEGTTEALEALLNQIDEWFDDDKTDFIVNPSFELLNATTELGNADSDNHNVFGWTVNPSSTEAKSYYIDTQAHDNYMNEMDGSHVFDSWGGNPTDGHYVRQTIKGLPEGFYSLSARLTGDAGFPIQLTIGNETTTITLAHTRPISEVVTVPLYYHDGESDVVISAHATTWFIADDFQLNRYDYYYDEKITDAEYATTAIRYNTEIPAGFEVYYATEIKAPASGEVGGKIRNMIHLEKYEGSQLAAEEGVILYAEGNPSTRTYRFYRTADEVSKISGNILHGTSKRIEAADKVAGNEYYMLAKKSILHDVTTIIYDETTGEVLSRETHEETSPVVGFYKLAANTAIKANKAYLYVNSSNVALAKQLYYFSFGDEGENGEATAVKQVEGTNAEATIVGIYSLGGARQSQLQRGMNIVRMSDGSVKKVLVK